MKEQSRIANIVSSKFYPLLLFFVSFVFVVLFSRSTSFLYVFEGFDAAIFKQMGLALLRGKTLYIDYFDNKGCILYFINALGLWLGGNFALLLMQTLSLTVTLLIWDKMLAFYRTEKERLVCLGIALVLLLGFYDGGDLSEEWCLPFASYPILVYLKALNTQRDIRKGEMFAIGICFGIIAFIRINNASPFLGFIVYLFIIWLLKKDFKKFFSMLFYFLLGTALIAGSCVLYFYLKAGTEGVSEMLYGTFLSYFEYFDYTVQQHPFHYVFYILLLVAFLSLQCIHTNQHKEILIPMLLSYTIFGVSSGTRCFTHYLMASLPLFVVGLMTVDFKKYRKINLILTIFVIIPLLNYLIRPVGFFFNDLVLQKEPFVTSYREFHRNIMAIPEAERDSIYNYNLSGIGAGMMQHEGLLQCNRILYSPLAFRLPKLHNEEVSKPYIMPKWILISGDKWIYQDDVLFIQENYDLISYFYHDTQYIEGLDVGELSTVCFYRRKD